MPLLGPGDHARAGLAEDAIALANPMVSRGEPAAHVAAARPARSRSAYNESHRNLGVGLFELGHVFRRPAGGRAAARRARGAHRRAGRRRRCRRPPAGGASWRWPWPSDGVEVARRRAAWAPPDAVARCSSRRDGTELGARRRDRPGRRSRHTASASGSAILEVDAACALLACPHGNPQYRRVSRYPSSDLDLAFVVPDERAGGGGDRRALGRPAASCSPGSSCSTCTAAPACPRAPAASPTACACRPPTARSPTPTSAGEGGVHRRGGSRRRDAPGLSQLPRQSPKAKNTPDELGSTFW